jgi:poly [ADP-ribose] polymerase
MKDRADLTKEDAKIYNDSNTALMFHGTRSVNVTGILRESLRLPKQLVGVVITGAMFGSGVYFADDWKKSAGYTSMRGSYWSAGDGAVRGRGAFMFLTDVVCGNPHVAPYSHGYTGPPAGTHCIFGKAGHSGVMNNEWIVFNANQFQLRYLVEFDTK